MLVVLTETYCNKVNIQITQRDGFIQKGLSVFTKFQLKKKLVNQETSWAAAEAAKAVNCHCGE